MKSIVVVAYYHIMHSLALAMTFKEKPLLYVSVEYAKITDDILERIKKTGVFEDVIKIDTNDFINDFLEELRKTAGLNYECIDDIGNSIFEKYLEEYYSEKFKTSNFDEDIYIYTDYHLSMYFIDKHFKNIIMGEDGYKTLKKRIDSFEYLGYFNWLKPFIELNYYPELNMKSSKIKSFICSGDYEELEDEYKRKITVWDFKDIVRENKDEYKRAILQIFNIEQKNFEKKAVLLLEQPLYRTGNCSNLEYYLFYKKLIREQLITSQYVYLKPHPAGRKNMTSFLEDNVELLPAKVPVEVFNYADVTFEKAITFYSTSLELLENIDEKVALYDEEVISSKKIKMYIHNYIRGEQINIGIYIKCCDIDKKKLTQLRSYFTKNPKFVFNINFIIKKEDHAKFWNEFLTKEFNKYRNSFNINILEVERLNNNSAFQCLINSENKINDYSILIDSNCNGSSVISMIKKMFGGQMGSIICCNGYQYSNKRAMYIYTLVNEKIIPGISNVLWNKEILRVFKEKGIEQECDAIEYIYNNDIEIGYIYGEGMQLEKRDVDEISDIIKSIRSRDIKLSLIAYFIAIKQLESQSIDISREYNWEELNNTLTEQDVLYIKTAIINILSKTITMENIEYSSVKKSLINANKKIQKIYSKKLIRIYRKIKRIIRPIYKKLSGETR